MRSADSTAGADRVGVVHGEGWIFVVVADGAGGTGGGAVAADHVVEQLTTFAENSAEAPSERALLHQLRVLDRELEAEGGQATGVAMVADEFFAARRRSIRTS